ncbi:flagellar hook-associated family protein [Mesorhizobium australicum]|uniref:Flagellin n=1 Tax=Mesorhizobium australicum TaxID=536018 RepID=A0A1X7PM38_9HYPH|nr:flagellar hook-associated family protein [Mesorhizobium australicum]SMH52110.1 flagellar hook-associated protein 3 FlgL [Mesorhizobium australicum]
MKSSYVSSNAISQALRYSMMKMQTDLVSAQKESTTLRVADVGLALGSRTSETVSLARDVSRLNGIIDSNALVSSRLTSTQDVLGQLTAQAEELRSTLSAAVSGSSDRGVVQAGGAAMMDLLTSSLNTSINGQYLFAGINTDVRPISDFSDPSSPARAAFDTAFQTYFGFSQTDADAADITSAEMEDFLTNVVEPQFLGAGWETNWSSATDEGIVSRIALNETAETSVSANITGLRKLAMVSAITSSMMQGNFSEAATKAVTERALALTVESISDITDRQALIGVTQQRVTNASERIDTQIGVFESTISDMESVDPYEAATRVSALVSQIETAYALTARIQNLSLLKYMS